MSEKSDKHKQFSTVGGPTLLYYNTFAQQKKKRAFPPNLDRKIHVLSSLSQVCNSLFYLAESDHNTDQKVFVINISVFNLT